MLKEIKLGFKLLKYSYKLKMNVVTLILFLAIGVFSEVMAKGTSLVGGVYFMIGGMFAYQLVMSMDVSQMIQSTAMKKKLQIYIPAMVSFIIYMVIFTFLVIEKVILIHNHAAKPSELVNTLLWVEMIMASVYIFTSICYKFFVLGFVVFMVLDMSMFMGLLTSGIMAAMEKLSFGATIVMGYAIIILGTLLVVGVGKLLYKKPLSEFAFRGIFRDAK